jgi:acyl-ACP thioesterase
MNETNDIERISFSVRFGDIDRSDRLTLSAVFNYFQDAALMHAEALGVGREPMSHTGQIWILSRMSVLMERRPRYEEKIMVRSWPRGSEKLFAVRDYDVLDETGKAIVRGRSGWLIADIEKHRPLRPQAVVEKLPKNEGLDALPDGLIPLEKRSDLLLAGERIPRYSDIDYNGHVNNTRYIQWIQDVTPPDILENADSMRFDIYYISETKLNEVAELLIERTDNCIAYEGRRSGAPIFRAELKIPVC